MKGSKSAVIPQGRVLVIRSESLVTIFSKCDNVIYIVRVMPLGGATQVLYTDSNTLPVANHWLLMAASCSLIPKKKPGKAMNDRPWSFYGPQTLLSW